MTEALQDMARRAGSFIGHGVREQVETCADGVRGQRQEQTRERESAEPGVAR